VTWLPEEAEGATPLDHVFGLRPDLYEPFRAFYAVFWEQGLVDALVLELCRLRVAQLLGCESELGIRYAPALVAGLTEEQVADLAQWPTSSSFTDAQRAALAFAEQFVIDPHGIAGPVRDTLRAHYSLPEIVALTEALALFDGFQRFRLVLGVVPRDTGTIDEPLVVAAPDPDAPLY
jgi:alkylhydroperoxidase family enzyme